MTALEPASDHQCAGCEQGARVWVEVGLANPEPCCRACASRVASEPAFKEALAAAHSEPVDDALPPFHRPAVSPPQPAVASPPRSGSTRSEAARRSASIRRRCLGCDMTSNPGALALHARATGHTGWEVAS